MNPAITTAVPAAAFVSRLDRRVVVLEIWLVFICVSFSVGCALLRSVVVGSGDIALEGHPSGSDGENCDVGGEDGDCHGYGWPSAVRPGMHDHVGNGDGQQSHERRSMKDVSENPFDS